MTALLTEAQVHGTTEVAGWLREHLDWQRLFRQIPPVHRMIQAHRLLLASYEICRIRYAQAVESRQDPHVVCESYVELRQAAWTVRLTAWIYRGYDGWRAEWFEHPDETVTT